MHGLKICAALGMVGLVSVTMADDYYGDPGWRGSDNSIWAEYVSSQPQNSTVAPLIRNAYAAYDLDIDNEFLFYTPSNVFPIDQVNVPGGPFVPGVGQRNGTIYKMDFPNFIDDLPRKRIQIQLTWFNPNLYQYAPSVYITPLGEDGPFDIIGDTEPTMLDQATVSSNLIGHAKYEYTIFPNPDQEVIEIFVPEFLYLEQVYIDTISEVPEPGSLSLIGFASLLALRRR